MGSTERMLIHAPFGEYNPGLAYLLAVHVSETASAAWVLDLARAEARLDFCFDSIWNGGSAVGFDVASDIRKVVPEAVRPSRPSSSLSSLTLNDSPLPF